MYSFANTLSWDTANQGSILFRRKFQIRICCEGYKSVVYQFNIGISSKVMVNTPKVYFSGVYIRKFSQNLFIFCLFAQRGCAIT